MTDPGDKSLDKTANLVARARAGDPEAMGSLYRLYQARLGNAVRPHVGKQVRSREETVDLIQTVWKDVLGDMDRFEYQGPDSFFRWVLTRLINKIRDKGRYYGAGKRDVKREKGLLGQGTVSPREPAPPAVDATPSHGAMENEQLERLMGLLDHLPEDQRQALVLRMRDSLEYKEIGEVMGRSADAARKLCGRALKKIHGLIKSEDKRP